MHDAYEPILILEGLPLQIESLAAYDDNLLVGTKQGHLLMYSITPNSSSDHKFDVQLIRSNKYFSKKPITQIAVVPDLQVLVGLSDNVVSVHDLAVFNFPVITLLSRTKGATLFTLDIKRQQTQTGEVAVTLRMCVAVKRKIQLYYWKNRNFHELVSELNVPDLPKVIAWSGESLCVGFKGEYCLLKVSGEQRDLFPTGKHPEPRAITLSDGRFALGRDEQTIFINTDGNPTQKYAVTWSEAPIMMEHDAPYLVSVLSKCVEVRTIEPKLLIQNMELAKPRMLAFCSKGQLYVASTSHIWCLCAVPVNQKIPQLLQTKQFELALQLVDCLENEEETKTRRVQHIRNLYAFDLFCKRQFKEAMTIFYELDTDPSHIIGLFPDLLPQGFREQLEYPGILPELAGLDLENGLLALIEYLIQVRHSLMRDISLTDVGNATAIVEGTATIKSRKQLLQIIDTTLLKCYIQTNDALVASLVRLPDNNCHIEESERALKKYHKYSELIIFYQRKGLHQKALDLLLRHAKKTDSPLKGHERTVLYLEHMGKEHLDLVFEFAGWVLKAHPESGLKIFTEDLPEVESLPREKVFEYLLKTERSLVVPYLEHVINVWKDGNPFFHNALIHQYREQLTALTTQHSRSQREDLNQEQQVVKEPESICLLREKLLEFLRTSNQYLPEQILVRFPYNGFHEERAILMGKIGRHEQALAIYTCVLQDRSKAENYCRNTYNPKLENSRDVYLSLLRLYVSPPDAATMCGLVPSPPDWQPNVNAALTLLQEHPNEIDSMKALSIMPNEIRIVDIRAYLDRVLQANSAKRRSCQIVRSLLYAEHLQVEEQRILHQGQKIVITELNNCIACKKRIGNSAFARFPNGDIVHYSCRDKYQAMDT